jgi:hypothetical protein
MSLCMSKQTKDLVAAAHQAFAMDEISLKQLGPHRPECGAGGVIVGPW